MIFVTVGTHEQPFNRLIEYMDHLISNNFITEEVIMQTGYSTYQPQYCQWSRLLPYTDMVRYVAAARIIITHGGPSSFIMPLQIGKIPIVVPRRKEYNEHVNDHQVNFCREVSKRMGNIIVVEDMNRMEEMIESYDSIVMSMPGKLENNNARFCKVLEKVIMDGR